MKKEVTLSKSEILDAIESYLHNKGFITVNEEVIDSMQIIGNDINDNEFIKVEIQ